MNLHKMNLETIKTLILINHCKHFNQINYERKSILNQYHINIVCQVILLILLIFNVKVGCHLVIIIV